MSQKNCRHGEMFLLFEYLDSHDRPRGRPLGEALVLPLLKGRARAPRECPMHPASDEPRKNTNCCSLIFLLRITGYIYPRAHSLSRLYRDRNISGLNK